MLPLVSACADCVRRRLAFSSARRSWQDRTGLVVLLVGAAGLLYWRADLPTAVSVLLWLAWLVALAVLLRHGWLRLFGPVLTYELIRSARRRRYLLIRALFAAFLAIILLWMYSIWAYDYYHRDVMPTTNESARVAEAFFLTFMSLQFAVVALLTPAYTAGAIAEEKERKTLEFLLATDLQDREIILSKLASRVILLVQLALTGLPILSFTQFFGGIDPNLLLVAYAVLGLTLVSLAALSILCSVLLKRARDAIVLTYLLVFAYLGISAGLLMFLWIPGASNLPVWFGAGAPTLSELLAWLNAGNIFVAVVKLVIVWGGGSGGGVTDLLLNLLRNYAAFHGFVILICTVWSVVRVRALALKQSYGQVERPKEKVQLVPRPKIGSRPMLWKEIIVEGGLRFGRVGRAVILLLVLASFLPPVFIFVEYYQHTSRAFPVWQGYQAWDIIVRDGMNAYARGIGSAVACLMLLGVAVRAAGAISGERERQTFDGLLTTTLSSSEILLAKFIGCLVSVRWGWLWLGVIWLSAALCGGIVPQILPFLPLVWLVYAALFAGIGLSFSMHCATTLRALMWTILTIVFLSGGHWLLGLTCCYLPLNMLYVAGSEFDVLMYAQFGQTPPMVLGFLTLRGNEFDRNLHGAQESLKLLISCIFGQISWGMAAVIVWFYAASSFRQLTGREPVHRHRRTGPQSRPIPEEAGVALPPDGAQP